MNLTTATVEESRGELEVPQHILRRSGFAAAAPLFAADLAAAGDHAEATRVVSSHGRRLWSEAARQYVADDRALYWARLSLLGRLRSWRPQFPVGEQERAGLVARLEHASRGHDDLVFPPDDRLLSVIVTGLDPFDLDTEIRGSNASGAAALALHGATFDVAGRSAVVRAAIFPVRWRDFTGGMVERALLPHYVASGQASAPADAVITVAQGHTERFELAARHGAWRGDTPDNERVSAPGPIAVAAEVIAETTGTAAPAPPPRWTESSLPRDSIVGHATGRFPVSAPTGAPTEPEATDGPGNDVAYRATLLRDLTHRRIPVGHIATPALRLESAQPDAITGSAFERDRADIVEQLRTIVRSTVDALWG